MLAQHVIGTGLQGNSLLVDFRDLFGYPSHLIINAWGQGIDWVLQVEGEEPEVRTYLTEAPMPLEFIATKAEYSAWYETIPEEIRERLAQYPEMGFAILYHVNHYPAAYELFISHPTLLWVLLRIARSEKWTEEKVVSLLKGKRVNILQACGLPRSPAAVKLLTKLDFDEFCKIKYRKIIEGLQLPCYAKFNRHKTLDYALFSLLIRFPELSGSALLKHYDSGSWSASTELLLRDICQMERQIDAEGRATTRVKQCKNIRELNTLHDRLVIQLNHKAIEGLPDDNFPAPPLVGTAYIVPISGSRELALEGKIQHHCVSSYAGSILTNKYFVYRVLAPERATLGLTLRKGGRPSIEQLRLSWNLPVATETRQVIEAWLLKAYSDTQKDGRISLKLSDI